MASNLASAEIATHSHNSEAQEEEEVRKVQHNKFRLEFLNRIDGIITFRLLIPEETAKIVELQMKLGGL